MAQITWPAYTARVELTLRPRVETRPQSLRWLACRLRWILAAAVLMVTAPLISAWTMEGVTGPASPTPKAIASLAAQARSVLSVSNYEVTLPLQEAKVLPPPPPAPVLPYGSAFWQPIAEPPVGTIMQIIWSAAQQYNVSYTWLLGVARCESGLNPTDVNRSSGATGLFQFMPATFYGHGGTDIWNPVQQSEIAAKMFSMGESGEWTCK